ncbi:MAG: NapC/NirT family cytochrome c, partial [Myxococcota bacterium]
MKRTPSNGFRRLRERLNPLSTRSRYVLGAVAIIAVVAVGASVFRTYDYVQHDNDFCTSCHLMREPFEKFQQSAHAELSCKVCHNPTTIERAKMAIAQVVEHPIEVRVSAEVPNEVCAGCHVDGDPEQWSLISNTAGHLVHLESEEPVLENIECVDCHSSSVHEFAPTDETCGQSECHAEISVGLGEMKTAALHCLACHEFTRETDPRARARGDEPREELLRPGHRQCLACHEMRELVTIAPVDEPHEAVCSTCHDAHG